METRIYNQEVDDMYHKAAVDYAKLWNVTDAHVIQIMKSVMLHRDGLRPGGGFVQSVVENNLNLAVGRADDTCAKYLKEIVAAKQNCYVQ
jgi:hypothetical protein